MTHSISPEEYARVIAKVYEPDLDWDKPAEYDLLDRETLVESAKKVLARLAWSGFVIQRLDDLALDEFDLPPRPIEPDPVERPAMPGGSLFGALLAGQERLRERRHESAELPPDSLVDRTVSAHLVHAQGGGFFAALDPRIERPRPTGGEPT